MTRVSNILGVACLVGAGLFLSIAETCLFIPRGTTATGIAILLAIGLAMAPAVILSLIGLALHRLRQPGLRIGIVLLSVNGFILFMGLSNAAMRLSPDLDLLPPMDAVLDIRTGGLGVLAISLIGLVLVVPRKPG